MMGRIGQPGQRTTSRQDMMTEVKITLRHIAWSTVFGYIILVLSRLALLQILREVVEYLPGLEGVARFIYSWWFRLGFFAVPIITVSAGMASFIIQIFDINWPPPRAAQRAADGPNIPVLRRLFTPDDPQPDTLQVYSQRGQPSEPEAHPTQASVVTLDIRAKNKNTGRDIFLRPQLTAEQWKAVIRSVKRGNSVSVRDLARYGGLSKGPDGEARAVNSELMEYPDLWVRRNQKPIPTPEFMEQLLAKERQIIGN